jgi:hypothetical protein
MKIVINVCHGGFGLSEKGIDRYIELKGLKLYKNTDEEYDKFCNENAVSKPSANYYTVPYEEFQKVYQNDVSKTDWPGKEEGYGRYNESNQLCWSFYDVHRNDAILVQVVEELGELADGRYSELKVVEIPEDVQWHIGEYDGWEWVAENHRTWR